MIAGDLTEARFRERLNRFLVKVDLQGGSTLSHLPNPGRLKELLRPGARVYLQKETGERRRTRYDLVAVEFGSVLVSVDSRLPNRAILTLLREGRLKEFEGYSTVVPEAGVGGSRVDFLLRDGQDCYLEVKSCTLVVRGTALFPDAPTDRGTRHLGELTRLVRSGLRAAILFVVQRPDATLFRPNDEADPKFGEALRRASAAGVEVHAHRCRFDGRNLIDFERIQTSLSAR